ncbi:hypothetical protein BTA51_08295 [Hahella sp. CCB-MM4]|uniref:DUF4340 domain-containing protein n=1 Tax=Hahella sp. (strain CCB-MM4) TaxID=1926491 RepID=UPI000B9C4AF7|nr:DUF4340 domain-containing protein [Hahella sp. CCB-MM4]OZG73799.1 hypothetical protein BTA51_08295 [Hahella sp. CCB-MM4]
MNTKWTKLLSAAFVLQLALITATHWPGNEPSFANGEQPLLAEDLEAVDEVQVYGEDSAKVVLKKQQGDWVVSSYYNLPAAPGKIDQLISSLKELKSGWPVATTATAAKRFEVTDDKFQRKVELLQDGSTITSLYLGTSPGYRKVHARVDSQDNVFAVKFATHEVPTEGNSWVDTGLTAVPEDNITDIKFKDIELAKGSDNWQLSGLQANETSNEEAIRKVLDALANLNFLEVLGTEPKPEYRLEEPKAHFILALKDADSEGNKTLELTLTQPQEGDYYILTRSDRPEIFKVPSFRVTALLDLNREGFYSAKVEGAPEVNLGQQSLENQEVTPAS